MKTVAKVLVILVVMTGFINHQANAQTPVPPNPIWYVDSQLRVMFTPLDKPTVHPNFLYEMAAHIIDTSLYVSNCPDTINYDIWNKMYEEMRASAYDTSGMITADSVYAYDLGIGSDTVTMNIMAYNYYRFNDTALSTNTYFNFDTVNNTLSDKYPRPGYPYVTDTVFAACPSVEEVPYDVVTFRIDPSMIFHDQFNPIGPDEQIISIDFGDGTGFHDFPYATTSVFYYTANYSFLGAGVQTAVIQTVLKDVTLNIINKVSKSLFGFLKKPPVDPPDTTLSLPGLNVGVYEPCQEQGGPDKKYFIYCEGFDPGDIFWFLNHSAADVYTQSVKGSGLSDLRNFGYEIMVVDWKDSRLSIEQNAYYLIGLIRHVKCLIAQSDHPDEQIVIMGESMGGLVARFALAWMETSPPGSTTPVCLPNKMHDCRLLITMDAPNGGANVPLAYQHLYRNPLFSSNPLFGIIERFIGQATNELLDAQAAEEMLLYHVDTRVPFGPGVGTYGHHPLRTTFLNNLNAVGNYPHYCKMVAMSNGSIAGKSQTRPWDGAERTPGDRLANYTQNGSVNILWHNYHIYDLNAGLNTLSAGTSSICHLKIQVWMPVLKVYWFGVKIVMDALPVVDKDYQGQNMVPYDVAPGSTLTSVNDYYDGGGFFSLENLLFGFGLLQPSYQGNGHYHYHHLFGGGFLGAGMDLDLYSDGMNFCFIPTVSALDYNYTGLWDNIEATPVSTIMSKTPFDVITGIPENYPYGIWFPNTDLYNREHLYIRNDLLGDWVNGDHDNTPQEYPDCNNTRFVPFLNREIGDDTLLVENRVLPYKGMYDAEKYVGVNQRSLYYEYPNYSTTWAIPGIYSKANPLNISGSGSYGEFYAQQSNVQYDPPYTGGYSINALNWTACCNPGYKPAPSIIKETKDAVGITIYPNPVTGGSVNIRFKEDKNHSGKIEIFDVLGRKVFDQSFKTGNNDYSFSLGQELPDGLYLFLITDKMHQWQKKVVVNNRQF